MSGWNSTSNLAFIDGKIITVDKNFSLCQAIAIAGDRIVAIGSNQEILNLVGEKTRLIDLQGKTVLPGINDAHIHAALFAGTRPPAIVDVSYPAVKNIKDIKIVVGNKVSTSSPGEWIRGSGWDEGFLQECLSDTSRHLNRYDLDQVSPANPVYLVSIGQHKVVANSLALRLAGIDHTTRAAAGSEVVLDQKTGEPNGQLIELPAVGLLMKVVPSWTRDQKKQSIVAMIKDLNSRGITSITEGALGPGGTSFQGGWLDAECIGIYNDLFKEGKLSLRVNILFLFGSYGACSLQDFQRILPQLGIHSGFGNSWLKIGGVKIFADGIPNARTIWMHEEFPGGGNGSLVISGHNDTERYQELIEMIAFAHQHGFQVGIHAIGGRAIAACLDGFIKAEKDHPSSMRHYIIHGDFISDSDIQRMANHNIGICVQPVVKCAFSDAVDKIVGVKLSDRQFPLRSLIDAGVHVSASSDAPVIQPDWLLGIQSALLRQSRGSGIIRGPQQRITVKEALQMYTVGGAWQDHQDHLKGSLEPGKFADLCILDQNILTTDVRELTNLRILATVAGGRLVYDAGLE